MRGCIVIPLYVFGAVIALAGLFGLLDGDGGAIIPLAIGVVMLWGGYAIASDGVDK